MNIYKFFKRLIDILLSSISLILLLPLFIPVIIILFFSDEGEIFYKQERVGYRNSIFEIYKFATMIKNSENIGTKDLTIKNDPRVTKIGSFLRKTKINELPQVFNVLIGDMSIIGPRPLMKVGFSEYPNLIKKSIYSVKPGLSGIGSIVFRDEEKIISNSSLSPKECYKQVILPYKGKLEIWYLNNISFHVDMIIIFLTVYTIINPSSKLHFKIFKNLPKEI